MIVLPSNDTPFSTQINPKGIKNKYLTQSNLYNQSGRLMAENNISNPILTTRNATSACFKDSFLSHGQMRTNRIAICKYIQM